MSNFNKFGIKITNLETGEVLLDTTSALVFLVSKGSSVESLIASDCSIFDYFSVYKHVSDLLNEAMERIPVMESVFHLMDGHDEEREI